MSDPLLWNCERVKQFLSENGLQEYQKLLCDENRIDGRVLLTLTEKDLYQLKISALGDIKRLLFAIQDLQSGQNSRLQFPNYHNDCHSSSSSESSYMIDILDSSDDEKHNYRSKRKINQEVWKTGVSIVYTFIVHFVTSFAIIVAQERMPDKKQYRPLPDVMLDSITYVPWAYKVTEGVILAGFITYFIILVFHKYRFILLRRMFVIAASIFLFRSICVIVTSLPMPQENFNCEKLVFKNGWERFSRALEIYSGMGMKVSGLKTCGDYMFSGHTVTITTLILLINEYTPKRWIFLHILVWIVGLSGIIFILAGHGHYTLDVIVAFYITSRLFQYHHILANNKTLMTRDQSRLKKWFPVFYFFESNCDGIVPNEYEWPSSILESAMQRCAKLRNYLSSLLS
ncbi:sphingomyelin synthase-related protein 1-like [Mytilus trossulus]|uniref:sphingomyelin synthase-related protein 1-like n=1 Tax=Mytilus trossulus TaxID=6551 RepID=UPI003003EA34